VFFANSAWAQGSIILLTLTLYLYQFHKCVYLTSSSLLDTLGLLHHTGPAAQRYAAEGAD
jgi:hypothetical protein